MKGKAEKFVKATSSFGGCEQDIYAQHYTEENGAAFEKWMKRQHKADGIDLYRGYTFDGRYWDDCPIAEGEEIGIDQFTQSTEIPAFTSDMLRAVKYINDFGATESEDVVKVLFKVSTIGKHFVDVSELSLYPEEKEYRCERDATVRVESIKIMPGFLYINCNEI